MNQKKKNFIVLLFVLASLTLPIVRVTAQDNDKKTYSGDSAHDDSSEDFESEQQ